MHSTARSFGNSAVSVLVVPWERESWKKQNKDCSGNRSIKYVSFTAHVGQWSGILSSETSMYSRERDVQPLEE